MATLEEQLIYEITWRTDEIAILKTTPFLYKFSKKQFDVLQRYSIPAIYSLWEGFVVQSFILYIREINSHQLTLDQLNLNLLTHTIDMEHNLRDGRTLFDKKVKLVKNIYNYVNSKITISKKIPTNSNVNYETINKLLQIFNLNLLPQEKYKKLMDRMLLFRNSIAHGEFGIPINQKEIDEVSLTVINLIHEVYESIMTGYNNKAYLKTK